MGSWQPWKTTHHCTPFGMKIITPAKFHVASKEKGNKWEGARQRVSWYYVQFCNIFTEWNVGWIAFEHTSAMSRMESKAVAWALWLEISLGGGGDGSISYIHVWPTDFFWNWWIGTWVKKKILGRTRLYEYTHPKERSGYGPGCCKKFVSCKI